MTIRKKMQLTAQRLDWMSYKTETKLKHLMWSLCDRKNW